MKTVTVKEVTRNDINMFAAQVAMVAELANDNQKKKVQMVNDRLDEQHTSDLKLAPKEDAKLLQNTVMGVYHATAAAKPWLKGTVGPNEVSDRMGSGFRADKQRDHDYMFQAVTDPVMIEIMRASGSLDSVLRFELKDDLSTALQDFYKIRKAAIAIDKAYSMFPDDVGEIKTYSDGK